MLPEGPATTWVVKLPSILLLLVSAEPINFTLPSDTDESQMSVPQPVASTSLVEALSYLGVAFGLCRSTLENNRPPQLFSTPLRNAILTILPGLRR